MTTLLALLLCATMAVVAGLHVCWGLGMVWPAETAERLARTVVGARGITAMPSMAMCLAVAAVLAVPALWPLFAAGLLAAPWPSGLTDLAGAAMAAVFVGRGLAGYTRVWRRHFSEEPFATRDRCIYSPLCLALGAGFLVLVLQGRSA